MAYNLKIINYPNGEIQLRYYSNPMKSKEWNPYEDSVLDDISKLDPFQYKKFREVKSFDELTEDEHKTDVEANQYRNCNRTKQMVFTYARCVAWEWFVTITFSKDKVDRYDFDECSSKVRRWLMNQRRYAPDLAYLVVPEQHKDGAWHFHAVLANTGDMRFIDSGHKSHGDVIYNMIKWQYGFTTATKVKDIHRVAKYIGKYITKGLCDITPGRQRYYVSQNLPKPKEATMLLTGNMQDVLDTVCTLATSWGKEIAHITQTRAEGCYTKVAYIELN